ncbi:hypothetical protein KCU61_g808, partial [Aureobasidium melanogenum]
MCIVAGGGIDGYRLLKPVQLFTARPLSWRVVCNATYGRKRMLVVKPAAASASFYIFETRIKAHLRL